MGGQKDPIKSHAKNLFEQIKDPWPLDDPWSQHTKRSIAEFVNEVAATRLALSGGVNPPTLNVGSHGNVYGLSAENHFHVDIAEKSLKGIRLACIADVERLPFGSETFDIVLCVGSVINYCSAAAAIFELARVLKPGGQLLLEFETSDSLEFAFTRDLGRDVTTVRTFYNGTLEQIYVYSRRYVTGALKANGLTIYRSSSMHLVSPLVYRAVRSERVAARFSGFDKLASKVPLLRDYSANVLMAAQKA